MTKKTVNVHQYECPSCGSTMHYDGDSGNLKCIHCGSTKQIVRDYIIQERGFEEMVAHAKWSNSNVSAYRCDNCGATTMLNSGNIATSCPYCKSPVVLDKSAIQSVRPDTVIPFNIGTDRAKQEALAWRKKCFWAPNKFRKSFNLDDMSGTYAPVWTFDSDTNTSYHGTVGYRRTRTVKRNGKTVTETYIDWRRVSGRIDRAFDDIIVRGSEHVPLKHFNKLLPFPQNQYVSYDDDFFAGLVADNYTVSPQNAFETAQGTMKSTILRGIQQQHRADVMGQMDLNIQYRSRSFKYVMVPVYVVASQYGDKVYTTYVSGIKTGEDKVKITGQRPVSWKKVLVAVLIVLALAVVGVLITPAETLEHIGLQQSSVSMCCNSTVADTALPDYLQCSNNWLTTDSSYYTLGV